MRADISGRLDALNLFEILGLLKEKKSTGRLVVTGPDGGEFEIFVADGAVMLAQRVQEPMFEQMLVRFGADREIVTDAANLSGDWLRALSVLGYLAENDAERLISTQCVKIGIEIASLEEGNFDFYQGVECELTEFSVEVLNLQLEIARQIDELKRVHPEILERRATVITVVHDPWDRNLSLSLDEWRLVHAVGVKGGSMTLGEAWDTEMFGSRRRYSRILRGLAAARVVELAEPPPVPLADPQSVLDQAEAGEEGAEGRTSSTRQTTVVVPELISSVKVLRPSEIEVHAEFQLVEIVDGEKARSYTLREQTSLGRAEDNDIRLPDPSISRKHALFSEAELAVHLQIIGRSNPALVDGQKFVSGWLKGGEMIIFYPYCFLLEGKAEVRERVDRRSG